MYSIVFNTFTRNAFLSLPICKSTSKKAYGTFLNIKRSITVLRGFNEFRQNHDNQVARPLENKQLQAFSTMNDEKYRRYVGIADAAKCNHPQEYKVNKRAFLEKEKNPPPSYL